MSRPLTFKGPLVCCQGQQTFSPPSRGSEVNSMQFANRFNHTEYVWYHRTIGLWRPTQAHISNIVSRDSECPPPHKKNQNLGGRKKLALMRATPSPKPWTKSPPMVPVCAVSLCAEYRQESVQCVSKYE